MCKTQCYTVEPSYLPGINSLFIVCIGIIRNNSLMGGRARAEVRTSATERVTLYCTWRPSAVLCTVIKLSDFILWLIY